MCIRETSFDYRSALYCAQGENNLSFLFCWLKHGMEAYFAEWEKQRLTILKSTYRTLARPFHSQKSADREAIFDENSFYAFWSCYAFSTTRKCTKYDLYFPHFTSFERNLLPWLFVIDQRINTVVCHTFLHMSIAVSR